MWKKGLLVFVLLAIIGAFGIQLAVTRYYENTRDPAFFEDAIVAFEDADRSSPPEPGAVVFVGSSSIRFWNSLESDMNPLPVLERGFGGAHMEHVLHNADRIITPYAPRAVVVYAGDNDLAKGSGKSPEVVVDQFQQLITKLRAQQSQLPIYFITIKPSPRRWDRWSEMKRANQAIQKLARDDPNLTVLDIASPMLGPGETEPPSELFALDGLHLSEAGYASWTAVIRPTLHSDLGVSEKAPSETLDSESSNHTQSD